MKQTDTKDLVVDIKRRPRRKRTVPRSPDLLTAEQVLYDAAIELGNYLRYNPLSPQIEGCLVRFESAHLDVELWTEAERQSDAAASAEKSKTRPPSTP
jgi:hypothetical protein